MTVTEVSLAAIVLEDLFRQSPENQALALHLSCSDIRSPLIIEGPTPDATYFLVEGYRRFSALQRIGKHSAPCVIYSLTDERTRVLKRLQFELHTKKRTSYEIERMILYLFDHGLKIAEIAKETGLSTPTIRKYIKTSHVNPETKTSAEKNKVSKEALAILVDLNLPENQKSQVEIQLLSGEIKLDQMKAIALTVRNTDFQHLSDTAQQRCIQSSVQKAKFTKIQSRNIIQIEKAKECFHIEAMQYLVNDVCTSLRQANVVLHSSMVKRLSQSERNQLRDVLQHINIEHGIFTQKFIELDSILRPDQHYNHEQPNAH